MRIQIIILLISICLSANAQNESLFEKWDSFFSEITFNGKIDYQKAIALDASSKDIGQEMKLTKLSGRSKTYQKAFWINAYNYIVINQIAASYPISTVQEIPGFFSQKHLVAGREVSLDEIEREILWQLDPDPRIHFALICGANSCPQALAHVYHPDHLDAQLTAQCRKAINRSPHIFRKENKEWQLSMIFKWYANDFGGLEGVKSFIHHYSNDSLTFFGNLSYQEYDWSLNNYSINQLEPTLTPGASLLQTFTPSRLLKRGQWDIKWFHNLYTETTFANEVGEVSPLSRRTFYEQRLEIFTSVDTKGRWNMGFVTTARSTILTNGVNGEEQNHRAIESVFFPNDGNFSRSGWTTFAPSLKWVPFPQLGRFSIQSSIFIPLVDQAETPIFLNFDSYIWENRIFYDKTLGASQNWQLFSELDINYTFGPETGFANASVFTPVTIIMSYFPSNRFTVYGLAQHGQRWGKGAQDYTQMGIGAKWQMTKSLNLEVLYNQFVRGRSTGLGRSYNVGLRYIYL